MGKHSSLGGSVIGRRLHCPGSMNLCKDIPSTTSVYAQEGTAAHTLGELALKQREKVSKYMGTYITNGDGSSFEVTEEMVEAVDKYVTAVKGDYEKMQPGVTLLIEQNFNLD